jgi:hypothetical protein
VKRRERLLVAAILVPFAALVVARSTLDHTASSEAIDSAPPSPSGRARSGAGAVPTARSSAAAVAPNLPFAPEPGREARDEAADFPATLEAALAAVSPEVRLCFDDASRRLEGAVSVRVAFRPLADGGFAEIAVAGNSSQDPYLSACVTDVFEEMAYQPSGREDFQRATHTFVFDPGALRK